MKFLRLAKKEVRLDQAEKEDIRGLLLKTMQSQPVRVNEPIRHKYQRIHPLYLFLTSNRMIATIIAAVLLALSGGTSYAAENSLPGDLLYPVKITVNENVRAALVLSPQAKVEWEAKVAERRLQEAEQLAALGKLSEEKAGQLEEKFGKQSAKVQERLDRLTDQGELSAEKLAELHSNFQASLEAHSSILQRLQTRDQDKTQYNDLLKSLANTVSSSVKARLKFELNSVSSSTLIAITKSAAEGKKKAAENKLREVEKYYEDKSAYLDAEIKAEVSVKLAEVAKIMAEGDAKLSTQKYAEAFAKYQEAMHQAQAAKMLMDISRKIKIKWPPIVVNSTSTMVTGTVNVGGAIQFKDKNKADDNQQPEGKNGNEKGKSGENIKVEVKLKSAVEED